jgi:hypothetical protein
MTRGGRIFGELVRVSAAMFMVRSAWAAKPRAATLRADEIDAIVDLQNPRS